MEGQPYTYTGLKKLCVSSLILLSFHTLKLYSIFSVLHMLSPSNDSNPIISLSLCTITKAILSQFNALCLPLCTKSPGVILNVFLSFCPFYFLPSLLNALLSSPASAPTPCSPALLLSDKGEDILKSAWLCVSPSLFFYLLGPSHPYLLTIDFSF